MKATSKIAELIKQYMNGDITPQGRIILEQWCAQSPANAAFFKSLIEGESLFEDGLSWMMLEEDKGPDWLHNLKQHTLDKVDGDKSAKKRQRKFYFIYSAVAAVLLVAGLVAYFRIGSPVADSEISVAHIQPGTNKATLVLSNGKKINLRGDKEGIVLDDQLTYTDGTPLLSMEKNEISQIHATVQVPKGGKYSVTLSDGTTVWLNAQSTLVYPLVFDKRYRKVKLVGEGYFQVASVMDNNGRVPFEVLCEDQKILVTGTAFNVSAYPDDTHAVTTLVEGAVRIETENRSVHLKPNQQAISGNGEIRQQEVDVKGFVAWKDDKFLFYETELRDLMKAISRWYAIDVSYGEQIPPTYFYGEIDRNKNLEEVLRIIEKSGLKFKLQKKDGNLNLIVREQ
ncbi:FecR family protein [Sphingobacterium sp. SGR-19]|uniref:FecR family protein n=1 Tax=Sphingobacterium sp. SGR-19 TaxID=2710886 RepID=UPI0013ECC8C1|nr:FecR family protein [Sphingobacterium sp. SGR-19]NGM65759.1 FecR family protein [Sphingobacterium sp. SGR-19]